MELTVAEATAMITSLRKRPFFVTVLTPNDPVSVKVTKDSAKQFIIDGAEGADNYAVSVDMNENGVFLAIVEKAK